MSEDETGRSSSDQENLGTEWHLELVHPVDSTRCGFEKGGLFVGEVFDLVTFGKVATVSGESRRGFGVSTR